MPKKVDYAARFEFLRQAAFHVVLKHGTGALTRGSIAAELGISVNTVSRLVAQDLVLECLALDEVARRRRRGRGVLPTHPNERAMALLLRLMPEDDSRIEEETVWLRVAVHHEGTRPDAGECPTGRLSLRAEYQIADRGWADEQAWADGREAGPDASPDPRPDARRAALAPHFRERATHRRDTVERALELIGVLAADTAEAERLDALLDGLTLSVCTGRATPASARQVLERHLGGLATSPARVAE